MFVVKPHIYIYKWKIIFLTIIKINKNLIIKKYKKITNKSNNNNIRQLI